MFCVFRKKGVFYDGGDKCFILIIKPYSVKRVLNAFAKSIDPCQPAQSAQADMGRYFSLNLNLSAYQRVILAHDWSIV